MHPDLSTLSCPLCGSDVSIWLNEFGDCHICEKYKVICDNEACGCETNLCDTPEEAVEIWNKTELVRKVCPTKTINW